MSVDDLDGNDGQQENGSDDSEEPRGHIQKVGNSRNQASSVAEKTNKKRLKQLSKNLFFRFFYLLASSLVFVFALDNVVPPFSFPGVWYVLAVVALILIAWTSYLVSSYLDQAEEQHKKTQDQIERGSDQQKKAKNSEWSPFQSWCFGVAMFMNIWVLLGFFVFVTLSFIGVLEDYQWTAAFIPLVAFSVAGFLFSASLHKVPLGERGVFLFIGEPKPISLAQGIHLMLPGLFGAKNVLVKTRTQVLDPLNLFTADNVPVTFKDASITWKVEDPLLFLGIDEKTVIKTGLDDTYDQSIRKAIRSLKLLDVLGKTFDDLSRTSITTTRKTSEKDGKEVVEIVKVVEVVEQKKSFTEKVNDLVQRWGVKIVNVRIPEITLTPEFQQALGLPVLEEFQKAGQEIEINLVIKSLERILGTEGMKKLDPAQVIGMILAQIGKNEFKTTVARTETYYNETAAGVLDALKGAGFLVGGISGRGKGGKGGQQNQPK